MTTPASGQWGQFQNTITDSAGSLELTAIHSPNFLSGSAGWTINKDGTVEFNNGIFRGVLQAGSISNTPIGGSTITGSDYQGGTMEETTITFDSGGGLLLIYSVVSTVTTKTTGSGTIGPIPAGVTTVKAECWGSGASGGGSLIATGGGGGEYAAEFALAVTPGNSYAYSVGAGGAAGPLANNGNNSTFAGDSVTVTAHGGSGSATGGTGGAGGTGSTNSSHFNGGTGGANAAEIGGGGGGGSGGTSATGNAGQHGSLTVDTGGAGGTAVSGGGAGGAGGSNSGNGVAGSAPGGAGGGASATGFGNGGAGATGQVRVTWQTAKTLIAAIAPVSGTDSSGTAYPQGIAGVKAGVDYAALSGAGASNAALLYGAAGAAADVNLYRGGAGILATDDVIQIGGTTISAPPANTVLARRAGSGPLSYVLPTGTSYNCMGGQVSTAWTYTNAGNNATPTDVAAITIPANELVAFSIYEISADGWFLGGQTTSEIVNMQLDIAGINTGSTSTAALGISVAGRWTLTARLCIKTIGVGGTCLAGGSFMMSNIYYSLGNANSTPFAVNTTIANVLSVRATWGGAGGSNQLLTCGFATFKRVA